MPISQINKYDGGKNYSSGWYYSSHQGTYTRRYLFRVYSKSGTYIGLIDDVVDDPVFQSFINGGQGELRIKTKRPIDNYDTTLLALGNIVRVAVWDEFVEDKRVYEGIMISIDPFLSEDEEATEVTCVGSIRQLMQDFYRSGSNLEITQNSKDPSAIIELIIDNYRTNVANPLISYTAASIDNSGNTVSYTFKRKYHLDAIKQSMEFFPQNWYFTIRADGIMYVKNKANGDHVLHIGRHITHIETRKNTERMVNKVFFWNGRDVDDPLYLSSVYNDTASQTTYGVHSEEIVDGRVTVQATADNMSNRLLALRKDPKEVITLRINPQKYDTTSLYPGQTVNIRNLSAEDQTTFSDNLTIVSVTYSPLETTLELEMLDFDIGRIVEDVDRETDRRLDDLEDRTLDLPNVNLSDSTRAHTAIVATDDSEEYDGAAGIQSAINAVEALGGGTVLMREGTYTLTADLEMKSNVILKGEGMRRTIIDCNALYRLFTTSKAAYITGTVNVTNGNKTVTGNGTAWLANISVGDVFIKSNANDVPLYYVASIVSDTELTLDVAYQEATLATQTYRIFRPIHNFGLFDFQIFNPDNDDLIDLPNVWNVRVERVWGHHSQQSGLLIKGENWEVRDCQFQANDVRGIDSPPATVFLNRRFITNTACNNNTLDGMGISDNIQVGNCTANNNASDGVATDGDNNEIRNLNATGNAGYGVLHTAGSDNNTVANCQLAGNTTGAISDSGTGNLSDNNHTV